jgi:hypothetical protein
MDEKSQQMLQDLTQKAEGVRNELIELEQKFNVKKEEFFKLQGAIEAIQAMASDS